MLESIIANFVTCYYPAIKPLIDI